MRQGPRRTDAERPSAGFQLRHQQGKVSRFPWFLLCALSGRVRPRDCIGSGHCGRRGTESHRRCRALHAVGHGVDPLNLSSALWPTRGDRRVSPGAGSDAWAFVFAVVETRLSPRAPRPQLNGWPPTACNAEASEEDILTNTSFPPRIPQRGQRRGPSLELVQESVERHLHRHEEFHTSSWT